MKGLSVWVGLKTKKSFPFQSTGKKEISQTVADEIKAFQRNIPEVRSQT